MRTKKISLILLSIVSALCLVFGTIFMLPKNSASAEVADFVVEDNFLDGTVANQYFAIEHMATNNDGKGDSTYGLVPYEKWGGNGFTGNGYITYKINADEGYVFDEITIDADVGLGHGGGLYDWQSATKSIAGYRWEGADRPTLDFQIYVSSDNVNWTACLYSGLSEFCNSGHLAKEKKVDNVKSLSITLDSSSIPVSDELYVKLYIVHPEVTEFPIPNYDKDGVNLNQVGACIQKAKITGSQAELPTKLTVSDNFDDNKSQNHFIDSLYMISDGNGHGTFGFVPSTGKWDGYTYLPNEAYLTYLLQASNGCYIESLDVDTYVTLCHWGFADDWSNANIKIQASYNNVDYFDLYNLRADKTIEDVWVNGTTYYGAKGEGCLNGGDYIQGKLTGMTEAPDTSMFTYNPCDLRYRIQKSFDNTVINKTDKLYIRITCLNVGGSASRTLAQCPTRLHNASFTITQKSMGKVEIEDNMTTNSVKHAYAIEHMVSGEANPITMFNAGFGWVPASTWGDPAGNVGTGSVTYMLNSTPGTVLSNINFSMDYRYYKSSDKCDKGGANIIIYTSTDDRNYTAVYNEYNKKGIDTSSSTKTLSGLDLTQYANGGSVLYIKIELVCPEETSQNLHLIPVSLKGVRISAKQKFNSNPSVSVDKLFGDGNGAKPTGVYSSLNVVDGNPTFALIPTAKWDGVVNATSGNLVYKLSATTDMVFDTLSMVINMRIVEGANFKISLSSDNSNYTEVYNFTDQKLWTNNYEKAYVYNNDKKWYRGASGEELNYMTLAFTYGFEVSGLSDVYVKFDLVHPNESVALQLIKENIFSINMIGSLKEDEKDKGHILYETYGGVNSPNNPSKYSLNDEVILEGAVKSSTAFVGWYDNPEFTGDAITILDTSVIKDYKLYAKYDDNCNVTLDVDNADIGLVSVNGTPADKTVYETKYGTKFEFVFTENDDKIFYSVSVNGVENFVKDKKLTINKITSNTVISVKYLDRASVENGYTMNYDSLKSVSNEWKNNLYDYDNLELITFDGIYALGPGGNSTKGYVTYKVVAPNGLRFESLTISTRSKLSDFILDGRKDIYFIDYYFSTDGEIFNKVYECEPFGQNGAYNTYNEKVLIAEVEGLEEVYIKVYIGTRSNNWTALRAVSFSYTTQVVETKVNYIYQSESFAPYYYYTQNSGVPFDTSKIETPNGYGRVDDKIYTKATCTEADLFDPSQIVNGDLELFVKIIPASGSVIYNLDGGVNNPDNPTIYNSNDSAITIKDASKDGFTFGGWFTEPEFVNVFTEIVRYRTGKITLYAKWIQNTTPDVYAEITYNLDGGVNSPDNPAFYVFGEGVSELKDATKNGFAFGGWYDNAELTGNKITSISTTSTEDVELYAKWIQDVFTITYVLNGGVNSPDNPATYQAGVGVSELKDASKTDYLFDGWYDNAFFIGTKITSISSSKSGDITLYAKYKQTIFTITYELNGGINDKDNPTTYKVGVGVAQIKDAIKEGFAFIGWYNNPSFTGDKVTSISTAQEGNITLYAKYEQRVYTIKYVLGNDGINNPNNPTKYEVGVGVASFGAPTKTNPKTEFEGWYDNAEYTGDKVTSISVTATGDITLYAKWGKKFINITYELNGGTNNENNPTIVKEGGYVKLEAPTKANAKFNGWYDRNGNMVTEIVGIGDGTDLVLTAKWTEVKKGGCGSTFNITGSIVLSAISLTIATAFVLLRKKEN